MWSPLLPTAFHGSRRTRAPSPVPTPSPTGLSPPAELPSSQLRLDARIRVAPCRGAPMAAQPRTCVGCSPHAHARFGLVRVRSPLLAELFLLLGVLRCFSSPGSPPSAYKFSGGCRPMTGSGLPHSDTHGSTRTRPLPVAFRCPSRPSSACNAKASPTYVFSLTDRLATLQHRRSLPLSATPIQRRTGGAGPRRSYRSQQTHEYAAKGMRISTLPIVALLFILSMCMCVFLDSNQGPLPYQGSALTT